MAAYLGYALHAALVLLAAWNSVWTLPVGGVIAVGVGVALVVFGAGLYAAGVATFRSFEQLSGLDAGNLVTRGVYRFSRNPQNVGWGFVLLGVAVMGESALALLLVALLWLLFHLYLVRREEPYLAATFGEEYREYHSSAPRYLGVPRRR